MLQAALFDMDGLLVDSEPVWRAAYAATVAEHGVALTEADLRHAAGRRPDEVVAHLQDAHDLGHVPAAALEAGATEQVLAEISVNGRALPGVLATLDLLEEHGVPCAVASSNTPQMIAAVLDRLGLTHRFAVAYSAVHEEFGKPHPGVFLATAARLGVEPAGCVVFEDSPAGVRAARAAGMRCIAVPDAAGQSNPVFAAEARRRSCRPRAGRLGAAHRPRCTLTRAGQTAVPSHRDAGSSASWVFPVPSRGGDDAPNPQGRSPDPGR